MFLYGKHSVFERLKSNPQSIKKVYLQSNFTSVPIEALLKEKRIVVERVSKEALHKIKRADSLQGIVARVKAFEYADFQDLLERPQSEQFSFIFLDRIFDPQNLGAIMRTAACLGGFAMVIPKHRACDVTETSLHVACGGENFVPVAKVTNLTKALLEAKKSGYWALGGVVKEGKDITKSTIPFPVCLVVGSEGSGLRYGLAKHLDERVNIPMQGALLSFNVTGACAILCYEIIRQRQRQAIHS